MMNKNKKKIAFTRRLYTIKNALDDSEKFRQLNHVTGTLSLSLSPERIIVLYRFISFSLI